MWIENGWGGLDLCGEEDKLSVSRLWEIEGEYVPFEESIGVGEKMWLGIEDSGYSKWN